MYEKNKNSAKVRKVEAVIFDLDGTLAYTLGDMHAAMNKTMKQMGFPEKELSDVLKNINNGEYKLFYNMLPETVRDNREVLDSCVEIYRGFYSENCCETTHLYPGIEEAVSTLKAAGIKLAVLSNKGMKHAEIIINKLFPENTFEVILGIGGTDFPHKPNPEAVDYILGLLGVCKVETVLVGDSDIDVITAKNSALQSVCVCWGYRSREVLKSAGANIICENAAELLNNLI